MWQPLQESVLVKRKISIHHCFRDFLVLKYRVKAIEGKVGGTDFSRGEGRSCKTDVLRVIPVEVAEMEVNIS